MIRRVGWATVVWMVLVWTAVVFAEPSVHFSPNGAVALIVVQALYRARKTVDVAIYAINEPAICRALIAAHDRGVAVRIIADRVQSAGPTSCVPRLKRAGVPIHVQRGSGGGIMHLKLLILDGRTATLGSFNFTAPADLRNDEVLLVTDEDSVVSVLAERFERLWTLELDVRPGAPRKSVPKRLSGHPILAR